MSDTGWLRLLMLLGVIGVVVAVELPGQQLFLAGVSGAFVGSPLVLRKTWKAQP